MPAASPRINTVLEPVLFRTVARLAKAEGLSLSQVVRDLVKASVEQIEDAGWERLVKQRRRPCAWVSHADVKRRLKIR